MIEPVLRLAEQGKDRHLDRAEDFDEPRPEIALCVEALIHILRVGILVTRRDLGRANHDLQAGGRWILLRRQRDRFRVRVHQQQPVDVARMGIPLVAYQPEFLGSIIG